MYPRWTRTGLLIVSVSDGDGIVHKTQPLLKNLSASRIIFDNLYPTRLQNLTLMDLPYELEYEIVQFAVRKHPSTAASLQLVAHRVKEWCVLATIRVPW